MKKLKKIILLMLGFMMVFALAGCTKKNDNTYEHVKQSKTIVWGIRADTRLFGLTNIKTGKIEGFEIDLAKALTKQMLGSSAHAEFLTTTANTRIPLLKNHNVDAVLATMTITKERAKQVDFTNPYFPAGSSLLVPNSSKITNVKQLNGKTVLAVKGTTAVDDVHKYAPKAKVLQYDDYGQAMSALKAGQGVALTTDNGLLAGIAQENPGYKLVGGVYTNAPYGIAINKGQTQMVNHLNTALAELKKNGTYNRLINKWFKGIPGFDVKELLK
ncbi:transporter substrate-binding domain-containing protein [Lactobacillus amylolyticus]|uniref:ABC transporter, substrate-binding protein, family 3 n=1 Tax=Lactobacillus amylolyticus DSM 11664 TaxID=585524 RepID=D4YVK4_9LACO|nr:transporter substrate-binding domain-containing protein [Lactobacillus amylolyticus]EFG54800.1 ABC transporter, substrate-binding protein, family 3 [Lactobacillus amylolyticus DSM 11664]KRL19592.1 glutamine ABC superfamily ATP binding cassette transporter, binding protein [Lactobacillus amylolyticus DSM 11664]QFY04426.1 transporter substrate-binding domain-containing protein [Lactobacillus amylolyticus]